VVQSSGTAQLTRRLWFHLDERRGAEHRKHYSAEEKIRIVFAGLRGEESIAALCRREGIAESL
jgi:transposase-like protein